MPEINKLLCNTEYCAYSCGIISQFGVFFHAFASFCVICVVKLADTFQGSFLVHGLPWDMIDFITICRISKDAIRVALGYKRLLFCPLMTHTDNQTSQYYWSKQILFRLSTVKSSPWNGNSCLQILSAVVSIPHIIPLELFSCSLTS